MPIKTALDLSVPAREKYKREITLLSGGYFAPKAFPGGLITVYPWDSDIDEWLVGRGNRGKKHRVLYDLVGELADMNGCPVEDFLIGEVFLVLLVSRALVRDSKISLECTCHAHDCGHKWKQLVGVPDDLSKLGEKPADYPGYDEITLKYSETASDVVRVRPLQVKDELAINERPAPIRKLVSDTLARLATTVVQIGGSVPDNPMQVVQWLRALPPVQRKEFDDKVNELTPQLSTEITVACPECKAEFSYGMKFDLDFFRSGVFVVD